MMLSEEQVEQCRWVLKALVADAAKPNHPADIVLKLPEWDARVDLLCTMANNWLRD